MKIGSRYKIESDPMNVILFEKITRKKKDTGVSYTAWQTIGYYATVENALNGLVDQKVRDTELKDLKLVIKEISDLREMVRTALKTSVSHKGAVKV